MTDRTATLRQEHEQLRLQAEELCNAARRIPELDVTERDALRGRLVAYLRVHVAPHTWVDERVLYPEVSNDWAIRS